jgi:hypothetical protein
MQMLGVFFECAIPPCRLPPKRRMRSSRLSVSPGSMSHCAEVMTWSLKGHYDTRGRSPWSAMAHSECWQTAVNCFYT